MNQKEAFFDTTYIMQDSSVGDEFTTEQASSSNGMWLKLFSRLDQEGKSQVYLSLIHISEPTRPY